MSWFSAYYESRGGIINTKTILLGEVTINDVLKKINNCTTLWNYGYDKYLSSTTKKLLIQYEIENKKRELKEY